MTRTSTDLAKAPVAMSRAISSFEKVVGGRGSLVAAMHANPELRDEQRIIVDLLSDPANDQTPIGEICHTAGVHIGDILQLFKSGRFARAQVEAIDKLAEKLPEIAEDFASRAVEREVACSGCRGTGDVINPNDGEVTRCLNCRGTGRVTEVPTLDRQRLAFELGGLGPRKEKGAGVNIGIFNPSHDARVTSSDLKDLREATTRLLYPGRHGGEDTSAVVDTSGATDAEVIPSSGPAKSEQKEKQKGESVPIYKESLAIPRVEESKESAPPLLEPPGRRP